MPANVLIVRVERSIVNWSIEIVLLMSNEEIK